MSNGNCNKPWPQSPRMRGREFEEGKSGAERETGGGGQ